MSIAYELQLIDIGALRGMLAAYKNVLISPRTALTKHEGRRIKSLIRLLEAEIARRNYLFLGKSISNH